MFSFRKGVALFVLILVVSIVSGWMTEKLLDLPVMDMSEIWVNSAHRMHIKLLNLVSTYVDIYSYKLYVFLAIGCIVCYYLYDLLFTPLNRVRHLGDIGYLPDGKFSMKEVSERVKKQRLVGEVPPVFPNGWFGLMESFKLKSGEAKSLSVLGTSYSIDI